MSQLQQNQDFQTLPSYSQTTVQNASWVNVVLKTTHPDGSTSQVFYLAKK